VKKYIFFILLVFLFSSANPLFADDADLFATRANPNVLIILDNSNSMDEDFYGNAVGSFSPASKTVVGKKALRNIIDQLKDKLRVGLMTYRLSGVSAQYLHNSQYFVSYDPKSYCPSPPPECVTYAQTGNSSARDTCQSTCKLQNSSFDVDYFDEIINYYGIGSEPRNRYGNLLYPHTQRMVNPTDPTRYMYFKHALPFYDTSNDGRAFCYSGGYNPTPIPVNDYSSYSYDCYTTKTGTSDGNSGYSNYWYSGRFGPTDSDYALGYDNFGRRLSWYYVGRTWFSNSSPGNGYLHVPAGDLVDKNGNPNATYNNIWNKLDPKENNEAGYMSCGAGDKNTCSYVLNTGLTPTAGTFQEAIKYFKGQSGYTSPIDYWCRKNFIIYVTDGLPSVDESGTPGTAESLMPTVLGKIDTLRNIIKNIAGKDYNFDVKTYVLGVGLSDEAKLELDKMALHGGTDVSGHAYYADDPGQLIDALGQILTSVVESAYSFASPTVPSVRMIDKNTLYLSSFTPSTKNPSWPGSLKAYQLNPDGTLPVDVNGFPLQAPIWAASIPGSGSRVIKTYVRGGLKDFISANLAPGDLGLVTNAQRDALISYIRSLPLGDIFHSNSVIVGPPTQFFEDIGFSGTGGFFEKNKDRTKVIIVGANDGMLHAFNAATGAEEWAFIPNSLLKNLKLMKATHTYYVDSTPKVADVWFYSDPADTTKSWDEWRTVLVCGLRKGGKSYFALDITDTLNPKYLWEFPNPNDPNYSTILAKLGQSWSEPAIGRVRVGDYEKWVAFIGGGFPTKGDEGKVFYVVDMKTGIPIKEFSGGGMDKSLAAPPTAVDTNLDGYIDKVYIGDLKGQMWVFDVSNSDTTKWTGKTLFKAPDTHPIYYPPAVAFDKSKTPWVYFGTGDRENPGAIVTDDNHNERFYAVKDDGGGSYPRKEDDLSDVTTNPLTFTPNPAKKGWFIKFKNSEKVLAKPTVFNQLVYFTTFTPDATGGDPCSAGSGSANLYIAESLSGGGALTVDDYSDLSGAPSQRSKQIGTGAGVPSAPVISVDLTGKASLTIVTTNNQALSQKAFFKTSKEILYWREMVH
jgi:type IV pilus assembly protein PilY1